MKKIVSIFIFVILIASCIQNPKKDPKDAFIPKYPDMPNLGSEASKSLAGNYLGTAHMNMNMNLDGTTPSPYYDKIFTLKKITGSTNLVILQANITPGNMPFPVKYALNNAGFIYSKEGYMISGKLDVDVPYDAESQNTIRFNINKRITEINEELKNTSDPNKKAELEAELEVLQARLSKLEDYSDSNITDEKRKELQAIIDAQKFVLGERSKILKTFEDEYKLILYYPSGRIFFEGIKQ